MTRTYTIHAHASNAITRNNAEFEYSNRSFGDVSKGAEAK